MRSRRFNLYGRLNYEHRSLKDRIGATGTVTDKTAKFAAFAFTGGALDAWGGGSANAFSIAYGRGDLNIEAPVARAIDDASARTNGAYHKWNLSFVRLQHLTEKLSAYVVFCGQKAGKNLDSPEKLIRGGIDGVRVYPQGEAPGDRSYLLSDELRTIKYF